MKGLLLSIILFSVPTFAQDHSMPEIFDVSTASNSVIVKIYSIDLYESPLCTGRRVSVFKRDVPLEVDLVKNTEFLLGSVPNNKYRCVGIGLSSFVAATPDSDLGPCIANRVVTNNLFSRATYFNGASGDAPDGEVIFPQDLEQRVYLWYSTASEGTPSTSAHYNKPRSDPDTLHGINFDGLIITSASELHIRISEAHHDSIGLTTSQPDRCIYTGYPSVQFTVVKSGDHPR